MNQKTLILDLPEQVHQAVVLDVAKPTICLMLWHKAKQFKPAL